MIIARRRSARPLGGDQLHLLDVNLLHTEDRIVAAEQDDPAVLSFHRVDALVRLTYDAVLVSVAHPVRRHHRHLPRPSIGARPDTYCYLMTTSELSTIDQLAALVDHIEAAA